ncbi:MAG: hypothetical protein R3Y54_10530 [Eubacteriales bacterium]
MNIDVFKEISLRGRVAFAIRCFEYLIVDLGDNRDKWKLVLEILWEFANINYLDDWSYKLNEIVPDNLLEFETYDKHEFEYLTKEDFIYLYELYQNIDEKINYYIEAIHRIGTSHIYSRIIGYGEESFNYLKELVDYMVKNNLRVPNFNDFEQFLISQNNGFGDKFEGEQLSIIL